MDLIARLHTAGIPLAMATSSHKPRAQLFLQRLGLSDVFTNIVTGDDIIHSKPAPDIYLAAAEKLRISPGECVAIEDASAGIESAKAAGMKVVGYRAAHSRQDLSKADLIVTDFSALTNEVLLAL